MTEDVNKTEVVEVTRTVEVTTETAAAGGPVIESPAYTEVVEETVITPAGGAVTTYTRRGPWDFTDAQRIVIAVLLWLNIIVLILAFLALTGRISI
jgi:hypothetical protein